MPVPEKSTPLDIAEKLRKLQEGLREDPSPHGTRHRVLPIKAAEELRDARQGGQSEQTPSEQS